MQSRMFQIFLVFALTFVASPNAVYSSPVDAAKALIAACPEDLKSEMIFPFDTSKRTDWHFFPRDRDGLAIGKMTEDQKGKVWDLLETALSEKGMGKIEAVLRLEQVLLDLTQSPTRDPGKFQVAIWGDPSETSAWGWRFEGHHLSVNVTLQGDRTVSVTPTFFGANPATVGEGDSSGFRALPEQEDLAREFMLSLPKDQREKAIVAGELSDVESAGEVQVDPTPLSGLHVESLSPDDRALLIEVLDSYSGWFLPEVAESLGLTSKALNGDPALTFHWMGGLGEGDDLHTYRISGETFDIQYANNQSSANHVHTLFRTVGHDFGE